MKTNFYLSLVQALVHVSVYQPSKVAPSTFWLVDNTVGSLSMRQAAFISMIPRLVVQTHSGLQV